MHSTAVHSLSCVKFGSLTLVSILILAGCGGGGGSAAVAPSTPVAITATNAIDVSQSAMGLAKSMSGMKTFGKIVTGVVVNISEPSRSALDIALAEFNRVNYLHLSPTTVGVAVAETFPCATSGAITLSGTLTDPNATHLMAGDKITLTSNNCVENGETLTGSTSFSVNTFSGGVTDIAGTVVGGGVAVNEPASKTKRFGLNLRLARRFD